MERRIPQSDLWYRGTAPHSFLSQNKDKDLEVRNIIGTELMKVLARRYLLYGMILSLSYFFAVPKGGTYVRMM
jgi:hypothetical protein